MDLSLCFLFCSIDLYFCLCASTILSWWLWQPSEWEKIIANEATDKGLISKICKQLLQLNSRKIMTQSKNGPKNQTDISPKKTCRWPTNTWKDAQHHSLSEKCKSKPQCGTITHQVMMAAFQKSTSNKCWRGCGEKGTLLHCWWECKLIQPLWRTGWRFL